MGRPAKFTYDQLAKAADEIAATGRRPTMRLLREALGGGSDRSVHEGLKRWGALHPETTTRPAPELPQALLRAIAGEFDRVAAEARSEAEERRMAAEDETTIMSEAAKKLEDERDALLDQVDTLTKERDQLLAQVKEREQEAQRFKDMLSVERVTIESLRTDLAKTSVKVDENDRLRSDRDTERKAREDAHKDIARLEARLEAAQAAKKDQVDALKVQVADLQARLDRAEEQIQARLTQAEAGLDKARESYREMVEKAVTGDAPDIIPKRKRTGAQLADRQT